MEILVMNNEMFDNFFWHSSIGIDETINTDRFVTKLAYTDSNLSEFIARGDDLLIHKATKALWKKSEDGLSIEAVFSSDVLTSEELEKLAGED